MQTRNPHKYNKNAGRNRLRAIEKERRDIWKEAIFLAQRLAAVHDPSGKSFNVKPVTTLEDGRVVTLESIERKKEKEALKQAQQEADQAAAETGATGEEHPQGTDMATALAAVGGSVVDRLNPDRLQMLYDQKLNPPRPSGLSKTQQKKMQQFAPRPPPDRPIIPEGVVLPENETTNWLELWDLPDEDLERRVNRRKKQAARARKDLRIKQKTGKAERRAARDEKRRVYREIKLSWKTLREEERKRRAALLVMEDEERRRLSVAVTNMNRRKAMEVCEALGFTLQNVEGVAEIQPKALGMKGVEVDFTKLEFVGEAQSGLKVTGKEKKEEKPKKTSRVDLGSIAEETRTHNVASDSVTQYGPYNTGDPDNMDQNFVEFGQDDDWQELQQLSYNHKVRRKLRRAMESAQIKKELLVREAAIKFCEEHGVEVPAVLNTPAKPPNKKGHRAMPDGTIETEKQERVRSKVELTEFNKYAKVLRKQAKEMSIEAGIRIYLELMGRIPRREALEEEEAVKHAHKMLVDMGEQPRWSGPGFTGPQGMGGIPNQNQNQSMADLLDSWPIPEDDYAEAETNGFRLDEVDEPMDESSEDSAAQQLRTEMADAHMNEPAPGQDEANESSDDSSDEEDSDVEMEDAS